jgi:hypothetical protein
MKTVIILALAVLTGSLLGALAGKFLSKCGIG